MASLLENLIDVLKTEDSEYKKLVQLSRTKTPVIIQGDLGELERITDEEQIIVGKINALEKKRMEVLSDIGNVLNKDVKQLKLANLISMLGKSPKEQKILSEVHDELKKTIADMQQVNQHNQMLIEQSLEIVDFNMNILRAMKAAPETANYTKKAMNSGYHMGSPMEFGGFDAKQ